MMLAMLRHVPAANVFSVLDRILFFWLARSENLLTAMLGRHSRMQLSIFLNDGKTFLKWKEEAEEKTREKTTRRVDSMRQWR